MKRLPISGASLAALILGRNELSRVLGSLGATAIYDDSGIDDLYMKLATVHGRWWAERDAREVGPVVDALRKLSTDLTEATELLSGHDNGVHTAVAIETTSQIVRVLIRNPATGSVEAAHALIDAFKSGVAKIQEACFAAFSDLTAAPSKNGRDSLGWYDDFTNVLLEIAAKLGVNPTLRKDRVTGQRSGWLLDAALTLEQSFNPYMRSPSPEACGKRLERSRKRLLKVHRQNHALR